MPSQLRFVIVQEDRLDEGFTGCVGVFTNKERAEQVLAKLKAENDGYSYSLEYVTENPSDENLE